MTSVLLLGSIVILSCLLCSKFSNKAGLPMLLVFMVLGMLFGSDGLLKISFDNYVFAEEVCTFTLIIIMFYGGFGTNWSVAKPVAKKQWHCPL